jgi:ABC-2 type transport system ATP-binding protein
MSLAIEIRGLTKVYGPNRALDGIDLNVPEGRVFGFLGPNGAGKTTTLRILTGLARPTSGTALIFGSDVTGATNATRRQVGFLPDVPGFYSWMTAEEFLLFSGRLFALDDRTLRGRVASLLKMSGLQGVSTKIGGYSRGMKQRLGVAQALISAPRLLMLDEPTSALDPMGRKDVLEMIAALRGKTTVLFSTHVLTDVERVCDDVAILDRGRVVREASIDQLKRSVGGTRLTIEVERGAQPLHAALSAEEWVLESGLEDQVVWCRPGDLAAARVRIPAIVAGLGLPLVRMAVEEPSLEDVFVDLVGGER